MVKKTKRKIVYGYSPVGNPLMRTTPPLLRKSKCPIPNKDRLKRLPKTRFGKPVHLFADYDKDGVPNVFDCQPFNPKKQDFDQDEKDHWKAFHDYAEEDVEEKTQRHIKEGSKTNCPGCGKIKPFRYIGLCPTCEYGDE